MRGYAVFVARTRRFARVSITKQISGTNFAVAKVVDARAETIAMSGLVGEAAEAYLSWARGFFIDEIARTEFVATAIVTAWIAIVCTRIVLGPLRDVTTMSIRRRTPCGLRASLANAVAQTIATDVFFFCYYANAG